MLFLVWHLSIVINGHTSSDWSLGPVLIKVHCVSCLSLMGAVVSCQFVMLCVCVAHDVCVISGLSLVFLVFLLYDDGKKGYRSYFITTVLKLAPLQPSRYWLHCHCLLYHSLSPLYSHQPDFAVDLVSYSKGTELLLFILEAAPIRNRPYSHGRACRLVIEASHQAERKYIAVRHL